MLITARHRQRSVPLGTGRWSSGDRKYVLITCGVAALFGTAIFAVVEQSNAARASNASRMGVPVAAGESDRRPAPAAPQRVPPPTKFAAKPADEPAAAKHEPPPAPAPVAATASAAAAPAAPVAASSEEPATTGTFTAPRASAPPARPQAAPHDAMRESAKAQPAAASADCPLPVLNAVLADVSSQFGAVTVVATHQHKTVNHVVGSPREKLHHDCKAIDFRPERSRLEEIKAYLRGRPEIGGVESYRDGVIHMDLAGRAVAMPGASRPAASGRTQAGRDAAQAGL